MFDLNLENVLKDFNKDLEKTNKKIEEKIYDLEPTPAVRISPIDLEELRYSIESTFNKLDKELIKQEIEVTKRDFDTSLLETTIINVESIYKNGVGLMTKQLEKMNKYEISTEGILGAILESLKKFIGAIIDGIKKFISWLAGLIKKVIEAILSVFGIKLEGSSSSSSSSSSSDDDSSSSEENSEKTEPTATVSETKVKNVDEVDGIEPNILDAEKEFLGALGKIKINTSDYVLSKSFDRDFSDIIREYFNNTRSDQDIFKSFLSKFSEFIDKWAKVDKKHYKQIVTAEKLLSSEYFKDTDLDPATMSILTSFYNLRTLDTLNSKLNELKLSNENVRLINKLSLFASGQDSILGTDPIINLRNLLETLNNKLGDVFKLTKNDIKKNDAKTLLADLVGNINKNISNFLNNLNIKDGKIIDLENELRKNISFLSRLISYSKNPSFRRKNQTNKNVLSSLDNRLFSVIKDAKEKGLLKEVKFNVEVLDRTIDEVSRLVEKMEKKDSPVVSNFYNDYYKKYLEKINQVRELYIRINETLISLDNEAYVPVVTGFTKDKILILMVPDFTNSKLRQLFEEVVVKQAEIILDLKEGLDETYKLLKNDSIKDYSNLVKDIIITTFNIIKNILNIFDSELRLLRRVLVAALPIEGETDGNLEFIKDFITEDKVSNLFDIRAELISISKKLSDVKIDDKKPDKKDLERYVKGILINGVVNPKSPMSGLKKRNIFNNNLNPISATSSNKLYEFFLNLEPQQYDLSELLKTDKNRNIMESLFNSSKSGILGKFIELLTNYPFVTDLDIKEFEREVNNIKAVLDKRLNTTNASLDSIKIDIERIIENYNNWIKNNIRSGNNIDNSSDVFNEIRIAINNISRSVRTSLENIKNFVSVLYNVSGVVEILDVVETNSINELRTANSKIVDVLSNDITLTGFNRNNLIKLNTNVFVISFNRLFSDYVKNMESIIIDLILVPIMTIRISVYYFYYVLASLLLWSFIVKRDQQVLNKYFVEGSLVYRFVNEAITTNGDGTLRVEYKKDLVVELANTVFETIFKTIFNPSIDNWTTNKTSEILYGSLILGTVALSKAALIGIYAGIGFKIDR